MAITKRMTTTKRTAPAGTDEAGTAARLGAEREPDKGFALKLRVGKRSRAGRGRAAHARGRRAVRVKRA